MSTSTQSRNKPAGGLKQRQSAATLALYAKPTDRVGIIGIGGLGHMAVRFAAAYGCDVTAFTSSESKFDEAKGFDEAMADASPFSTLMLAN